MLPAEQAGDGGAAGWTAGRAHRCWGFLAQVFGGLVARPGAEGADGAAPGLFQGRDPDTLTLRTKAHVAAEQLSSGTEPARGLRGKRFTQKPLLCPFLQVRQGQDPGWAATLHFSRETPGAHSPLCFGFSWPDLTSCLSPCPA